jgi:hypothetical protein
MNLPAGKETYMQDLVNNPAHYTLGRSIQPIDVIEDWELDYHMASALKYISRAGRKLDDSGSGLVRDLEKAVWYLSRRLQIEERAKG